MSLKSLRIAAHLTQAEVAHRLHVTQSAVSWWERGKYLPSPRRLLILAQLYNCTVEDLLREEVKS